MNRVQRLRSLLLLTGSIGLIHNSYAISPINSVQNGRIIGGGYYNTAVKQLLLIEILFLA